MNQTIFSLFLCFVLLHSYFLSSTASASELSLPKYQSFETKLDTLANQLTKSLPEENNYSIAFLDFTDLDGNVTNLGRYLAEELTIRLFVSKKFQIVERRLVSTIMQEQKLTMTGLVNSDSSRNLGNLLGVGILATGTIANLGSNVKVNARMISPTSGEVLAVASVEFINDNKLKILQGKTITPSSEVIASANAVPDDIIGVWKDSEGHKEYYYEFKKSGFVYYCELDQKQVVDLDTGILSDTLITYSEGSPDSLTEIIEESELVEKLPQMCR